MTTTTAPTSTTTSAPTVTNTATLNTAGTSQAAGTTTGTAQQPFTSHLPVRPRRYVSTTTVDRVASAIKITAATGEMCLIDGPVGLVKTTAIVEAARTINQPVVYVNMAGTHSVRDEMDAIWRGITGINAVGTSSEIRDDILANLSHTDIVLLIDDAHRVKKQGLLSVLHVWNRLHTSRGKGTPIVWCGNELSAHLRRLVPEVYSRAAMAFTACPLPTPELITAVLSMGPFIAGTPDATISNINIRHFKGELRRWDQFLSRLELVRGADKTPRPLTNDEAAQVLNTLPGR